jgi:hypothetical protein
MDRKQRIVKNPSLVRELARIANDAVFNKNIIMKARAFIETGELNSVLKPYVKYNAPVAGEETNSNANANANAEPHKLDIRSFINLKDEENKKELHKCNVCRYRREILFKFHREDIFNF